MWTISLKTYITAAKYNFISKKSNNMVKQLYYLYIITEKMRNNNEAYDQKIKMRATSIKEMVNFAISFC